MVKSTEVGHLRPKRRLTTEGGRLQHSWPFGIDDGMMEHIPKHDASDPVEVQSGSDSEPHPDVPGQCGWPDDAHLIVRGDEEDDVLHEITLT